MFAKPARIDSSRWGRDPQCGQSSGSHDFGQKACVRVVSVLHCFTRSAHLWPYADLLGSGPPDHSFAFREPLAAEFVDFGLSPDLAKIWPKVSTLVKSQKKNLEAAGPCPPLNRNKGPPQEGPVAPARVPAASPRRHGHGVQAPRSPLRGQPSPRSRLCGRAIHLAAMESVACVGHADPPLECRLPALALRTRVGYSGDAGFRTEVWARQEGPVTGDNAAVRVPAVSSVAVLATGSMRGFLEVKRGAEMGENPLYRGLHEVVW